MTITWNRRHFLGAALSGSALHLAGCDSALNSRTDSWWQQQLPLLDGSTLHTSSLHGRPLIVNFWASWCTPCVQEMPIIDAFFEKNRTIGWQILGIAIDNAEPVKRFLSRVPVHFPIVLAPDNGQQLMTQLGHTGNSLPFTVQFDVAGNIVERHSGTLDAAMLDRCKELTSLGK